MLLPDSICATLMPPFGGRIRAFPRMEYIDEGADRRYTHG